LKIENPDYKARMVLCIPRGGNIKSFFFFLLEEKLCMGKKMSGKAGFFAHGVTSSNSFLREALNS
jgi:hypothetical protein